MHKYCTWTGTGTGTGTVKGKGKETALMTDTGKGARSQGLSQ
jgi:hypothetical protein